MLEVYENKSFGDINYRMGKHGDGEKIAIFAKSLSEDPVTSKNKWLKFVQLDNVLSILAEIDGKVVGKIQSRILDNYGWLEATRIHPKYRNQGIAKTLVDECIQWMSKHKIKSIRTAIESDNLLARIIVETKGFLGNFVTVNPSCPISDEDISQKSLSKFTTLLEPSQYDFLSNLVKTHLSGNIMINGQYIPLKPKIFTNLIEEKRILTNGKRTAFLIISKNKLPVELHVFTISNTEENYEKMGNAAKALAAKNMANFVVCHGPSQRHVVKGLVKAGLAWNQPHSLIIYQILD